MKQHIATVLLLLLALTTARAKADTWAVKSNLLYDVVAAPNIGIEYAWNGHWSLTADATMPWWMDKDQNEWCYEMLNVGIEARYWLSDWARGWHKNSPLHGHFLGLYGNGGCFDLGHDRKGWQSEFFWATGVSYGYNFLLSEHLRLECCIGMGCLRADYTEYKTKRDNSGIYYTKDGIQTWWGPTKADVTLIWAF